MMKRFIPLMAVGLTAAFLAACNTLPPSKPLDQLTPQEAQGRGVYETRCASCHYPNKSKPLNGPGLQALFKKPYLPSGAPANEERIRDTILHGRKMMPALNKVLDDQQLDDLMAYLHTL